MGPRSEQFVFNSVLNFRRVTHFWLCVLETQVQYSILQFNQLNNREKRGGYGKNRQNREGTGVECFAGGQADQFSGLPLQCIAGLVAL